jgi:hypothetical protein
LPMRKNTHNISMRCFTAHHREKVLCLCTSQRVDGMSRPSKFVAESTFKNVCCIYFLRSLSDCKQTLDIATLEIILHRRDDIESTAIAQQPQGERLSGEKNYRTCIT